MSLYQCGVTFDCPFAVVHLGGKEFPKTTQKVEGYGHQTKRTEAPGAVLELSEADVKAIRSACKRKFVRSTKGKRARARLVDTATKSFQAYAQDVPLGKYVYLKPVRVDPHRELDVQTFGDEKAAAEAAEKAKQEKQGTGKRRAS